MIYLPKSQPAPPCLEIEKAKADGNYNCEGVLQQLQKDFKNKCYLCEDKAPHSINTEHFKPHKGNKELKFDWNNLFFCCVHCNSTKSTLYDDILNCTKTEDGVDTKIRYFMNPYPKEKVGITGLEDSAKVKNTVNLLLAVYNGTTELKTIESANLRSKLLTSIVSFQKLLLDFYNDKYNEEERSDIRVEIVRQLRPTSDFTAFKKWIIKDNDMREDFKDCLE